MENYKQEANPNAQVAARYFLTTRPRTQKFQPFIKVIEDVDGNGLRLDHHGKPGITISPYIENGTANDFTFSFTDVTDLDIHGGTKIDLGGSTVMYPRVSSYHVPQPASYNGQKLTIMLDKDADKAWQFVVSVFNKSLGAAPVDVIVNVDATELINPTDKITGTKGGY